MIDKAHPLPVTRQARVLELSRSSVYYEPVPMSSSELALMAAIDEIHMKLPFYGIMAFGNIHYGYVGRALGYNLATLKSASMANALWTNARKLLNCNYQPGWLKDEEIDQGLGQVRLRLRCVRRARSSISSV